MVEKEAPHCKIMKEAFQTMYLSYLEILGRCSSMSIPDSLIEKEKEARERLKKSIDAICGD